MHFGREAPGGNAIALVEIDSVAPPEVVEKIKKLPLVQRAKPLTF